MTEKKKERVVLSGQVRIPESMEREIDMEAARQRRFKYEVIISAWESYKRELDNSPKELPKTNPSKDLIIPGGTVHYSPTGPVDQPASLVESACLARVLRLLRSKKPELPAAAVAILIQLDELGAMYERQHNADAAPKPMPSEEERARETSEKMAALERTTRNLAERVRRAKADGEATRSGKNGGTVTPRKRGRA